jgi:hypothetical protein
LTSAAKNKIIGTRELSREISFGYLRRKYNAVHLMALLDIIHTDTMLLTALAGPCWRVHFSEEALAILDKS